MQLIKGKMKGKFKSAIIAGVLLTPIFLKSIPLQGCLSYTVLAICKV